MEYDGICMEYLWNMYGISKRAPFKKWSLEAQRALLMPNRALTFTQASRKLHALGVYRGAQIFQGGFGRGSRPMHGICVAYVWNMHGICAAHVWNMHGICMEHGWNMHGSLTPCATTSNSTGEFGTCSISLVFTVVETTPKIFHGFYAGSKPRRRLQLSEMV